MARCLRSSTRRRVLRGWVRAAAAQPALQTLSRKRPRLRAPAQHTSSPPPGQVLALHFEKSWVAHTQMKGSLLDVLALVEAAKQLNSDTKIAKEVATLSVRRTLRPCACRGFAMQGWGRRA